MLISDKQQLFFVSTFFVLGHKIFETLEEKYLSGNIKYLGTIKSLISRKLKMSAFFKNVACQLHLSIRFFTYNQVEAIKNNNLIIHGMLFDCSNIFKLGFVIDNFLFL